ncbi:hypothetical protein PENSOL_c001G11485 [Penicillium solitum]|uniref:Uncharacterized protein n=1 Tax=Penicillium solitum TaxID=60172 RepID=A0A1V6RQG4_9EURO|nr:uncharacterized protein PENSOL_c001G11485 [Penicillium solitum]OQE03818.1 hypothetical protein PENSOL_c001G11485 [Penicillium solitum]
MAPLEAPRPDVVPIPWWYHHEKSDLYWEAAADAIRPNIFARLGWNLHHGQCEREQSHRPLCDGYRSLMLDDKTHFDGATVAQVREDSKAFVNNEIGLFVNQFRWCLVIDREALQSFIRHQNPFAVPLQVEEDSTEESEAWVTVVEPEYEQEETSQYAGYMCIHLPRLRLVCLGDVVPMS